VPIVIEYAPTNFSGSTSGNPEADRRRQAAISQQQLALEQAQFDYRKQQDETKRNDDLQAGSTLGRILGPEMYPADQVPNPAGPADGVGPMPEGTPASVPDPHAMDIQQLLAGGHIPAALVERLAQIHALNEYHKAMGMLGGQKANIAQQNADTAAKVGDARVDYLKSRSAGGGDPALREQSWQDILGHMAVTPTDADVDPRFLEALHVQYMAGKTPTRAGWESAFNGNTPRAAKAHQATSKSEIGIAKQRFTVAAQRVADARKFRPSDLPEALQEMQDASDAVDQAQTGYKGALDESVPARRSAPASSPAGGQSTDPATITDEVWKEMPAASPADVAREAEKRWKERTGKR
jgi:hypothetical protein